MVLFCKNSPPFKRVLMQSQPIPSQSASKSKEIPGPAAPRASVRARTTVRKVAARKTLKGKNPEPAQESLHVSSSPAQLVPFNLLGLKQHAIVYSTCSCRPLLRTTPVRRRRPAGGALAQTPQRTPVHTHSRMCHHRLLRNGQPLNLPLLKPLSQQGRVACALRVDASKGPERIIKLLPQTKRLLM